jgi:Protein kinase domain/Abnormal spindle-like microcephaly-assoc'd, ASPM-SPD-2-Hydin
MIGDTFGHYRIEGALGVGLTARVYLARDLRMDRAVALKVLHPAFAEDDRVQQRFRVEGRRLLELEHENIVPVFEVGDLDGLGLCIAMRHIEGGDLAALLDREGPLEPQRVASIALQIGRALDFLHAQGLVYRDLKPANVLVAPEPWGGEHVYLGDLGFVRDELADATTRLSLAGEFMGTSAYMAPEQIEGDADARADVYGFGCLLFELLTGEPPFGRLDTQRSLRAHLDCAPPRATERRPALPPGLDGVLLRALAKSPDDRHPSCGALARAVAAEAQAGPGPIEREAAALAAAPPPPRRANAPLMEAAGAALALPRRRRLTGTLRPLRRVAISLAALTGVALGGAMALTTTPRLLAGHPAARTSADTGRIAARPPQAAQDAPSPTAPPPAATAQVAAPPALPVPPPAAPAATTTAAVHARVAPRAVVPMQAGPAGEPVATLSTDLVDFGTVPVGSSVSRTVTLVNTGARDLHTGYLAVFWAVDVTTVTDCNQRTLAPGAHCSFTMTFHPSRPETLSALSGAAVSDDTPSGREQAGIRGAAA